MTVNQLRNPKLASGYRQVGSSPAASSINPFQAFAGRGRGGDWKGPRRATAVAAVKDYIEYLNNGGAKSITLKQAGHTYEIPEQKRTAEEREALGILADERAKRGGIRCLVYLIGEGHQLGDAVKIGSSTNPRKRIAEIQTGNPRVLRLLGTLPGGEPRERDLQRKYADDNILGEWFSLTQELLSEFS